MWSCGAWAASRVLVVESSSCEADALVVLGGASSYIARTHRAAELYHQGCAPHVVLTNDGIRGGWSQADGRNLYFVERAARELVRAGVPPHHIVVLPQVTDGTNDEAVLLRDEAARRAWRRLTIVTSPYHTRRARWTFRRAFAEDGDAVACRASEFDHDAPAVWWLSGRGWGDVAGEYVKMVYYLWWYG